jgi:hypothetical protein
MPPPGGGTWMPPPVRPEVGPQPVPPPPTPDPNRKVRLGLILGVVIAVIAATVVGVAWAASGRPAAQPSPTPTRTSASPSPTTPSPTSPSPAPSPTSDNFTTAERTLLNRLRSSVFSSCSPAPKAESATVVAALNCKPVESGPTRDPLVQQYTSQSAMKSHMDSRGQSLTTTGDCSAGKVYAGTWTVSGTTKGQLICDRNGDYFRMEWTFDDTNIGMVAEAENWSDLFNWWKDTSF